MKKVIVTGATSMIGAALIRECLKEGVEVLAVVRKNSSRIARLPVHEKLQLAECELENMSSLPSLVHGKWDTFYHIAWGSTGANRNRSTELQSKNIAFTLEAVKAAKALGCTRFIGAGSQAEYGPLSIPKIGPDTPAQPITPYGISKLSACRLSQLLCRELEMEWIWPRIFSVYGIYEKETTMVSSALRKMTAGESTEFTPAGQIWDYLYSKDAGRAYYLMGEKGKNGSVYCVGSGEGRPLKEYIQEMEQVTQTSGEVKIGARPYPPGAVTNLCADISSLTEDTGFTPEYTFQEGIKETLRWMASEA